MLTKEATAIPRSGMGKDRGTGRRPLNGRKSDLSVNNPRDFRISGIVSIVLVVSMLIGKINNQILF